jgi:hypothetical protein
MLLSRDPARILEAARRYGISYVSIDPEMELE